MRTILHRLAVTSLALMLAAHAVHAQAGRVSVGPLVGSAPGGNLEGVRVPTVGGVADVGLLRVGIIGLHLGGTYESRAGAQMTGVSASLRTPLYGRLALRAGAAAGAAEVQRAPWEDRLIWRDWRGVDAGLEYHRGRTTGALMVRGGTIDRFATVASCPPNANCLAGTPAPGNPRRFFRVSFESRYSLF